MRSKPSAERFERPHQPFALNGLLPGTLEDAPDDLAIGRICRPPPAALSLPRGALIVRSSTSGVSAALRPPAAQPVREAPW